MWSFWFRKIKTSRWVIVLPSVTCLHGRAIGYFLTKREAMKGIARIGAGRPVKVKLRERNPDLYY